MAKKLEKSPIERLTAVIPMGIGPLTSAAVIPMG